MNILLITGGRDYDDVEHAYRVLDAERAKEPIDFLLHGDADGADTISEGWAEASGIHSLACKALWEYYGKPGGAIRNSAMLMLKPTKAVVFPGGKGTKDMTSKLVKAGVNIVYA